MCLCVCICKQGWRCEHRCGMGGGGGAKAIQSIEVEGNTEY